MSRKPDDARATASRRGESEEEVLDRNANELLQEMRVAETGVQLLFAFLLSLAFTQRFTVLSTFGTTSYVVALLSSALAAICFIAPVPFHRTVFRHDRKPEFVAFASRALVVGLVWLQIGVVTSVLLVLDVVLGRWLAWLAAGVIAVVSVIGWWLVPLRYRRRSP